MAAEMSRLFASEGAPDEAWERLEEVFNLEDQLAASVTSHHSSPRATVSVIGLYVGTGRWQKRWLSAMGVALDGTGWFGLDAEPPRP